MYNTYKSDRMKTDKLSGEESEKTESVVDVEREKCVEQWSCEQDRIKDLVQLKDVHHWQSQRCINSTQLCAEHHTTDTDSDITAGVERLSASSDSRPLTYVAGVDISFVKDDNVNACAACIVMKLPSFEIVHEDISHVELTSPYIPGYLAFREAEFLSEKIKNLEHDHPDLVPQAILVDGNGILHPKRCGLACHIGVLVNIPSVGVAKTLYHVDGIEKNEDHQHKIQTLLQKGGDMFPLTGMSGDCLGMGNDVK